MKLSRKAFQVLTFLANRGVVASGAQIGRELKLASGTLYPLLAKLEKNGLVYSEWEIGDPKLLGRPRRRFYNITGAGAANIEHELTELGLQVPSGWGTTSGSAS